MFSLPNFFFIRLICFRFEVRGGSCFIGGSIKVSLPLLAGRVSERVLVLGQVSVLEGVSILEQALVLEEVSKQVSVLECVLVSELELVEDYSEEKQLTRLFFNLE